MHALAAGIFIAIVIIWFVVEEWFGGGSHRIENSRRTGYTRDSFW